MRQHNKSVSELDSGHKKDPHFGTPSMCNSMVGVGGWRLERVDPSLEGYPNVNKHGPFLAHYTEM